MGPPRHNANQISKENKEDREDEEGKKEEIKKLHYYPTFTIVKLVSNCVVYKCTLVTAAYFCFAKLMQI